MIVLKIIRLPLKLLALPVALILLACHLVLNLIIGLSSFATNLLSMIFLIGAVMGWIIHAPDFMVWQAVAIGFVLMFLPSIAAFAVDKVMDMLYMIVGFIPL